MLIICPISTPTIVLPDCRQVEHEVALEVASSGFPIRGQQKGSSATLPDSEWTYVQALKYSGEQLCRTGCSKQVTSASAPVQLIGNPKMVVFEASEGSL